jgi:hypothetical protein
MPGLLIDRKLLLEFKLYKLLALAGDPPDKGDTKNKIGIVFLLHGKNNNIRSIPSGKKRVDYAKSDFFVNNIYDSYYVIYKKPICEIQNVIKDKNILKIIVETLEYDLPSNTIIWSVVPALSTGNYIDAGFDDPYLCKQSPLKRNFKDFSIAFIKENNLERIKYSKEDVKNKLKHLLEESIKSNCSIQARFSSKTIKYLKNINQSNNTSVELAGKLVISKVLNDNGKIVFELSGDPKSVIFGKDEEVDAVIGVFNFHTHPCKAYLNNKVTNGWPSVQDYLGFLELKGDTVFHAVITLEGIYIISFGDNWYNNINKISTNFIKKHYDIDHKINISFDQYVNLINNIKYKGSELFIVKYMHWDNATKIFPIFFGKKMGNCVISDTFMKIFYKK